MTIKFLLLVNKQGQTRLAKYFTELLSTDEKRALEGEIVRKCLARTDRQVGVVRHRTQAGRGTHTERNNTAVATTTLQLHPLTQASCCA